MELFEKVFETKGINTITNKSYENKNLSSKSLQKICSGFCELKKFVFHFKTKDNSLFENAEKYHFFIENLPFNLSKILKISPEDIIFCPA